MNAIVLLTVDDTAPGTLHRRHRRLVVLLTVAVLVAFTPTLFAGFVSDDLGLIVQNPWAQSLEYLGRCFRTDLFDIPSRLSAENWVRFYRPLVTSSYILNWTLSGGSAWSFHLVNVLAHLGAVLLAFRMACRWTGDERMGAAVALVFGIHPTRNESVIWISGRTDVFMALFLLLALELIVAASRRAKRAWLPWVGGFLAFVAAILSKEYAVILPLLLGVEVLLVPAGDEQKAIRKRLLAAAAVSLTGVGVYLALRARYMPIRPAGFESSLDLGSHATYVLLTVGRYLMRAVFPWPQVLTFRPIYVEDGHTVFPTLDIALGVLAVAGFLGLLAWLVRRQRWLDVAVLSAAGIAFLPIANVSYSGFNSTSSDRFFYFPLLLIALALVRLVPTPWVDRGWSLGRGAIAVGLALLCVGVAWVRSLDFRSDLAFWQQEVAVNPDCPIALAALAEVHQRSGDTEEAFAYLLSAYAPEARKYILVADPTRYYLYLLSWEAARLPDGDVRALRALETQMAALARGQLRRTDEIVGGLPLDAPVFDENVTVWLRAQRVPLASDAALVASRLGHDDVVREMASTVGDNATTGGAPRFAMAVALTRAGEYDAALHQLELSRSSGLGDVPSTSLEQLSVDIEKVKALRARAASASEPEASLLQAKADTTMRAWLRAARVLRLAYQSFPSSEPVWTEYVKALVFCRLDDEAYDVARTRLDDAAARAHLGGLAEQMLAKGARARAVPRGTTWW